MVCKKSKMCHVELFSFKGFTSVRDGLFNSSVLFWGESVIENARYHSRFNVVQSFLC